MPDEPGFYASSNGLELWCREEGGPAGEPILMIMGLSSQLIHWPQEIVDNLCDQGYRVIRFDNRDSGLSTKITSEHSPWMPPYFLKDMADDAAGLLDHLQIESAHVVGASMGGMIAQLLAIHHPGKVRSLCSIMSTTGNWNVGTATPAAIKAVSAPTPPERDKAIPHIVNVMNVIGSQTHRESEQQSRIALVTKAYDRAFYPAGGGRQTRAILAARDRTPDLQKLDVPTLVIHGGEDSLINKSGGQATHDAIANSEYLVFPDMGHDLPTTLHARIAEAIRAALPSQP